ncbi:MAG: hypothetical protein ACRDR6_24090 [Pseudonocardiaceae bacterium]
MLAARCAPAPVAVIVTALRPLGLRAQVRLGGLSEADLATVLGVADREVTHALWMASRGLPGVARQLVGELGGRGDHVDPVVHLALTMSSGVGFLDVDVNLVRLLECCPPLRMQTTTSLAVWMSVM